MRLSPRFVAASVFLGTFSPALVSLGGDFSDPSSRHGFFYIWFYWLPVYADQLLMPDGNVLTIGLAIAVYVVQYAMLLVVLKAAANTAQTFVDFLKPHKHRTGLIQSTSDGRRLQDGM
jgi:hypothetical protein